MTIDQIRKSWQQGAARGNSGAHLNFTDQMCKKSVIARACKIELDSTADNENDDLQMTPPDEAEAVRNQAQVITVPAIERGEEAKALPNATTIDPTEAAQYEQVGQTSEDKPKETRSCPI